VPSPDGAGDAPYPEGYEGYGEGEGGYPEGYPDGYGEGEGGGEYAGGDDYMGSDYMGDDYTPPDYGDDYTPPDYSGDDYTPPDYGDDYTPPDYSGDDYTPPDYGEDYTPPDYSGMDDDDDDDGRRYGDDDYSADPSLPSDDEAERLRKEHREAKDAVRTVEKRQKELNDLLELDFGPDMRFEALRSQCFTLQPGGEWDYEICPFKSAKQKPSASNSGHGSTDLGKWDGFGEGGYTEMRFAKGTPCWNGPIRSALVSLQCAAETAVLTVDEPEICKYYLTLGTPAACTAEGLAEARRLAAPPVDEDEVKHDEL